MIGKTGHIQPLCPEKRCTRWAVLHKQELEQEAVAAKLTQPTFCIAANLDAVQAIITSFLHTTNTIDLA